jgi:hypothetical protein
MAVAACSAAPRAICSSCIRKCGLWSGVSVPSSASPIPRKVMMEGTCGRSSRGGRMARLEKTPEQKQVSRGGQEADGSGRGTSYEQTATRPAPNKKRTWAP